MNVLHSETLGGRSHCCPNFLYVETEVQRGEIMCLMSEIRMSLSLKERIYSLKKKMEKSLALVHCFPFTNE